MTAVTGASLHEGDTILDPVDGVTCHTITALEEYVRFVGDHARRAHGDAGWGATILDAHLYELVSAGTGGGP
jgi:hypothetical protein